MLLDQMLTACLIVRGKPSRINPDSPLASPASSLFDNKLIIISSETNLPWLTISVSCSRQQQQQQQQQKNWLIFSNYSVKTMLLH